MPRQLAPCGTPAAYRRHLRNGEKPCAACSRAHSSAKSRRVSSKTDELATVTRLRVAEMRASEGEPPPLDPIVETRRDLQLLTARMEAGGGDLAGLSRRRQELVDRIVQLERASKQIEKVSALDQLARRRADRLAASAD